MDKKSGWVEKRQHERVLATLKMEYQVVSGTDAQRLLSQENYSHTTADRISELSDKSPLYRAVTKDISLGGLSLVSQQPLQTGMKLEISLHLPNYESILKFLAEIKHVETTTEMGTTLYNAGIQTLAIHKGDMQKIADYLIEEKKANS